VNLQTSKILEIGDGWYSLLTNRNKKLAKKRAEVCAKCPEKKYSKYLEVINDEFKEVKGYVCTQCSCPLQAKIRSKNSKCDLNKW
jgi:hypothetical protein